MYCAYDEFCHKSVREQAKHHSKNLNFTLTVYFVKPLAILDYNEAKEGVDVSDRMSPYCTRLTEV